MPDPIPEAYADCVHVRCRSCRADPDEFCTNPINGLIRGVPCWARIRDAESEQVAGHVTEVQS